MQQMTYSCREKITSMTENDGVEVDESVHSDLSSIMTDHQEIIMSSTQEGSFNRLFWEQQ